MTTFALASTVADALPRPLLDAVTSAEWVKDPDFDRSR
jgi:hypothetical protein